MTSHQGLLPADAIPAELEDQGLPEADEAVLIALEFALNGYPVPPCMAMGLTGASTLVRSVIKNFNIRTDSGPAASPQSLSSDDEVYALDRGDVVLDHVPIGSGS